VDKLIEMTADGRLAIAWIAVAVLLVGIAADLIVTFRDRNRRVSRTKMSDKRHF